MRSQSGSVPSSKSGRSFSLRARPSRMASRSSGLGYGQVGKCPSGSSCSGTTVTSLTPMRESILLTHSSPEPFSGVYTTLRSSAPPERLRPCTASRKSSRHLSDMYLIRPEATPSSKSAVFTPSKGSVPSMADCTRAAASSVICPPSGP